MGEKGARQTGRAADAAAAVVADLAPLGQVSSKKMFGGHGIFGDGVMFALIDSNGTVHLRADSVTEARFLDAGSTKHGRMPYWVVPSAVLASEAQFVTWASEALEVARAAKR
ncbi:MAG: TfoX/Sxy family protein [Acidimicrobiia bacterium]|nr:TfoX/Sxy family protein [Acidimicrobiia bacterium]